MPVAVLLRLVEVFAANGLFLIFGVHWAPLHSFCFFLKEYLYMRFGLVLILIAAVLGLEILNSMRLKACGALSIEIFS